MAQLVVLSGADIPGSFPLEDGEVVIGRQTGVTLKLNGTNVSRRHARIFSDNGSLYIEDLGSSNGTFVNGSKIESRRLLRPLDELRIGPYLFRLDGPKAPEGEVTIRARTVAKTSNSELFRENPGQKLQLILELAFQLSRTLELEELLPRLLEKLLEMFSQAERGFVLFFKDERPEVRAFLTRTGQPQTTPDFSMTVVRRVVEEGVGIVAEDIRCDNRFAEATLCTLGVRSFMCVPLRLHGGRLLGVLQLDRFGTGRGFVQEDLNLLTAVGLQASTVLENAQLHQELLGKQRLEQDMAQAREIQASFLPRSIPEVPGEFELHAELEPAYEVSGDFYDYFKYDAEQIGFVIADVSGKGMPAALFLTMVRSLLRHLAERQDQPGETLQRLNNALAQENPKCFFVTLIFGVFHPGSGEVNLACAGHPPPLLRRKDGKLEEVKGTMGPLLGFAPFDRPLPGTTLRLEPGDALLLYTDGITEAAGPGQELFGPERLRDCFAAQEPKVALTDAARAIRSAVTRFASGAPQEDDITLLLLRKR